MYPKRVAIFSLSIALNILCMIYIYVNVIHRKTDIDIFTGTQKLTNHFALNEDDERNGNDPRSLYDHINVSMEDEPLIISTDEKNMSSFISLVPPYMFLNTRGKSPKIVGKNITNVNSPSGPGLINKSIKDCCSDISGVSTTTTPIRSTNTIIKCNDRYPESRIEQRNNFFVYYNYVTAKRRYMCHESITYTTHSDNTYLENLKPLLERWLGPVSLSIYSPGFDFNLTLRCIQYAKDCLSPLVSEYVTFHVFFDIGHLPKEVPHPTDVVNYKTNCSLSPPWTNVTTASLYKTQRNLPYPVNVARNIARESAATHYILASDIELYPSPGLIKEFLEMVRRKDPTLLHSKPKVFPIPIFEIKKGLKIPNTKKQLVEMIKNDTAVTFHKYTCLYCHQIPNFEKWTEKDDLEGIHIFKVAKRITTLAHWEPIFIGTHSDPLYDERLSWEGRNDKMTHAYTMCVLDYEFQVLDNAFLVHKPGIKTLKLKMNTNISARILKTNKFIKNTILPEINTFYGTRKGCQI